MKALKFHLNQLSNSVSNAITRMQCYPDEIVCAEDSCKKVIPVPWTIFAWKCPSGHLNDISNEVCYETNDHVAFKKDVVSKDAQYCMTCPFCGRNNKVSTNNFMENINSTIRTAPDTLYATFNKFSEGAKGLAKPPTNVSCSNCTSVLKLPDGPWICTCETPNQETDSECVSCKQWRFHAGVVCGICNTTTSVPKVAIAAHLGTAVNNAQSSFVAAKHMFKESPYVVCNGCEKAIPYPDDVSSTNIESNIELTCDRCKNSAVYTPEQVVRPSVKKVFEVPNDAELQNEKPSGKCTRCASTATRRCMVCVSNFCDVHCAYIRRDPHNPNGPKKTVCNGFGASAGNGPKHGCVMEYDEAYMSDFIHATAPQA